MLRESAANPYPYFASLHAKDPVHRSSRGIWLIASYDGVHSMLRDPRFGRRGFLELGGIPHAESQNPPMQFQDPPGYARIRGLIAKAFTYSLVDGMRPSIQNIVNGLLEGICGSGKTDLIATVALPLSVGVILELLGVPDADHAHFHRWSRDLTRSLDAPPASREFALGVETQQAIAGYFRDFVAAQRKCPATGFVPELIAAQCDGRALCDSELIDICGLLFVAGFTTTVNLIGNGVLTLLRHPFELRRLRDDPGLLALAIEELLRYESPVQRVGRMANQDAEIGGNPIAEGAIVCALLGAANRDPAKFAQPDRFEITRRDYRHLAFGHGPHVCLGAPLARLEGQIAIAMLLQRCPHLALINDTPEWKNSTELRALKELRVTA
jgi:pimeloyl-[acyl-carrier protein] synthase